MAYNGRSFGWRWGGRRLPTPSPVHRSRPDRTAQALPDPLTRWPVTGCPPTTSDSSTTTDATSRFSPTRGVDQRDPWIGPRRVGPPPRRQRSLVTVADSRTVRHLWATEGVRDPCHRRTGADGRFAVVGPLTSRGPPIRDSLRRRSGPTASTGDEPGHDSSGNGFSPGVIEPYRRTNGPDKCPPAMVRTAYG